MTHSPSIKNNRKVVSPSKKFAHNNCKHSFYFSGLEGGSKERVIWRDFFLLYTVQWARKFKKDQGKEIVRLYELISRIFFIDSILIFMENIGNFFCSLDFFKFSGSQISKIYFNIKT